VQQLRHLSRQCTEDGIRPSPVNGVYESDTALDDELRNAVLEALKPLEEVSMDEKDWHPDSDNQVLMFFHSKPASMCTVPVSCVRMHVASSLPPFTTQRVGSRLLLLLAALTTCRCFNEGFVLHKMSPTRL
jgi:hypothetical protein